MSTIKNTDTTDSEKVSEALEIIFTDTSDFIVIGLTGRTGSGCSTSAGLLSSSSMPIPDAGNSHYVGNEERKYRIVKDYIDKKWTPFKWLQIRSVLTRYLLKLNFSDFCMLVSKVLNEDLIDVKKHMGYFEGEYNKFHLKIADFLSISEDSVDSINSKKLSAYELYFLELPIFANNIRDCLRKISAGAYTSLYQKIGDNVRASGCVDDSNFNPKKVFAFAETISRIIKSAKHWAKTKNSPCYLVVDAIRNPYEAVYLRERYSDFFLVSINTENENRLAHLRNSHKFTDQQIHELDKKEYPRSLVGNKKYSSQNIQKCIEIADIHINNPKADQYGTSELASQLAWYVGLMMHPGIIMPTSMETCMQIAYTVKKSSGCISRQVGAVVTDEYYSVKSVGWNNTPAGQVPCLLRNASHLLRGIDSTAYSKYERNDSAFRKIMISKFSEIIADKAKKNGRNLAYCFKDIQNEKEGEKNQIHTRALHAEENAFLQISKFGGQKLKGGILFTTASPCELCAKKAYQLGIIKIYYIDPYPGIATSHVLTAGEFSPKLILFRGAIGATYDRLYQPIMPYKEELDMLLSIPKNLRNEEILLNELSEENSFLKKRLEILEARLNDKLKKSSEVVDI